MTFQFLKCTIVYVIVADVLYMAELKSKILELRESSMEAHLQSPFFTMFHSGMRHNRNKSGSASVSWHVWRMGAKLAEWGWIVMCNLQHGMHTCLRWNSLWCHSGKIFILTSNITAGVGMIMVYAIMFH